MSIPKRHQIGRWMLYTDEELEELHEGLVARINVELPAKEKRVHEALLNQVNLERITREREKAMGLG